MIALFGNLDCNVAYLRKLFGVGIAAAGGGIKVKGDDQNAVELAAATIELLLEKSATHSIDKAYIDLAAECVAHDSAHKIDELTRVIAYTAAGKPVRAKTYGQACYVRSIERNTIVFGIGPAGTGKTYLAVALACNALRDKKVSRIVCSMHRRHQVLQYPGMERWMPFLFLLRLCKKEKRHLSFMPLC